MLSHGDLEHARRTYAASFAASSGVTRRVEGANTKPTAFTPTRTGRLYRLGSRHAADLDEHEDLLKLSGVCATRGLQHLREEGAGIAASTSTPCR